MARPPRACWVYKPLHQYRVLPRISYLKKQVYDYEENNAKPEFFPDKLEQPPPKLWIAWQYKIPEGSHKSVIPALIKLFGTDKPGSLKKMKVFKNTPYWNNLLWQVKSFIEVFPITFPQGEPTEKDISHIKVLPTGECTLDKTLRCDEKQLVEQLKQEDLKNFPRGYITSKLLSRWYSSREIQEDDVWSDPNFSRM